MLVFCVILWLVWLFINKKIESYTEESDAMDVVIILNKALLILNIILSLITILNLTSTPPHYKEFKNNVNQVMELNAPVVIDCKVSKKTVKVYVNQSYWSQLSTVEKADIQQRIKVTIQTIGENSGYLSENKKINVKFYNTGD